MITIMTFQPFSQLPDLWVDKPGDGTVEIFKELGIYCPSCFSLSNDLGESHCVGCGSGD